MPRLPCSLRGEGFDDDNQTPQQASFGLHGHRAQRFPAGDSGLASTAIQLSHYRTVEQAQQSLERAAIVRSGGKSASIKSISDHAMETGLQLLRQLGRAKIEAPVRHHHNHGQVLHLGVQLEKAKALGTQTVLEPRLGVHLNLQQHHRPLLCVGLG